MSMAANLNPSTETTDHNELASNINPQGPGSSAEMLSQASKHCVSSFAAINQMRANAQLCDITLEVGGITLDAHKVVLASASPYFYEMFNGNKLDHTLGIVQIPDMDVVTINHLIDYIYTGELSITEENVRVLLPASTLLQLHSVREACCKFLLLQLHPSNCLNIRRFADTQSCKEFYTSCHKYVLQNFEKVVETEDFLLLPFEEVRDLISNNSLNVWSEEKVYQAVLTWIKHHLDKRQKHIPDLMTHVRLPLVNRDFLITRVETEPLLRDDPQCKELLIEAMKYHLLPEQQSLIGNQRTQKRRPDGMTPYIFAVGGYNGTVLRECEIYNTHSNAWSTIAPMISRRQNAGMASLNKTLYVVGGHDGFNLLSTAESYNPLTNRWCCIKSISTKCSGLGACAYDGLIYVCGGYDGASYLKNTECYDPLTGIWTTRSAMNTGRNFCRLTVLDNCIYSCGGSGYFSDSFSTVERFDPRIDRWYPAPSMMTRRPRCSMATCDGFLYCIGGFDDSTALNSGERFNPRTNRWEAIADMNSARGRHGLVEVEGSLYALGGGSDTSPCLSSVERYDIHLNKWTIVESMAIRRRAFCAVGLDCFFLEKSLA